MAAILCKTLFLPCELCADASVACCQCMGECGEGCCKGCGDCCNSCAKGCGDCGVGVVHCCDSILGKPFSLCVIFTVLCSIVPAIIFIIYLTMNWTTSSSDCDKPLAIWLLISILSFGVMASFAAYLYSQLSVTQFVHADGHLQPVPMQQSGSAVNHNNNQQQHDYSAPVGMTQRSRFFGLFRHEPRPLRQKKALNFFMYDPYVAMFILFSIFLLVWSIVGLAWADSSDTCVCASDYKPLINSVIGASIVFLAFLGIGTLLVLLSLCNEACCDGQSSVLGTMAKILCCCIYVPCCMESDRRKARERRDKQEQHQQQAYANKANQQPLVHQSHYSQSAPQQQVMPQTQAQYQPSQSAATNDASFHQSQQLPSSQHAPMTSSTGNTTTADAPPNYAYATQPIAQPVARPAVQPSAPVASSSASGGLLGRLRNLANPATARKPLESNAKGEGQV